VTLDRLIALKESFQRSHYGSSVLGTKGKESWRGKGKKKKDRKGQPGNSSRGVEIKQMAAGNDETKKVRTGAEGEGRGC